MPSLFAELTIARATTKHNSAFDTPVAKNHTRLQPALRYFRPAAGGTTCFNGANVLSWIRGAVFPRWCGDCAKLPLELGTFFRAASGRKLITVVLPSLVRNCLIMCSPPSLLRRWSLDIMYQVIIYFNKRDPCVFQDWKTSTRSISHATSLQYPPLVCDHHRLRLIGTIGQQPVPQHASLVPTFYPGSKGPFSHAHAAIVPSSHLSLRQYFAPPVATN